MARLPWAAVSSVTGPRMMNNIELVSKFIKKYKLESMCKNYAHCSFNWCEDDVSYCLEIDGCMIGINLLNKKDSEIHVLLEDWNENTLEVQMVNGHNQKFVNDIKQLKTELNNVIVI